MCAIWHFSSSLYMTDLKLWHNFVKREIWWIHSTVTHRIYSSKLQPCILSSPIIFPFQDEIMLWEIDTGILCIIILYTVVCPNLSRRLGFPANLFLGVCFGVCWINGNLHWVQMSISSVEGPPRAAGVVLSRAWVLRILWCSTLCSHLRELAWPTLFMIGLVWIWFSLWAD